MSPNSILGSPSPLGEASTQPGISNRPDNSQSCDAEHNVPIDSTSESGLSAPLIYIHPDNIHPMRTCGKLA